MVETISIKEAAEILDVSPKTIRAMLKRGDIRAEKAQGRHGEEWRIYPDSLAEEPCTDHGNDLGNIQGRVGQGARHGQSNVPDQFFEIQTENAVLKTKVEDLERLISRLEKDLDERQRSVEHLEILVQTAQKAIPAARSEPPADILDAEIHLEADQAEGENLQGSNEIADSAGITHAREEEASDTPGGDYSARNIDAAPRRPWWKWWTR